MANQESAETLHKTTIRKFEKWKLYSSFKENIWDSDLADMQLISKLNKGIPFLLCISNIYSEYARVVPLKDEKCSTIP